MTNQMFEDALYSIYESSREIQETKRKCIKKSLNDYPEMNYYNAVKDAYDHSMELKDYPGKDIYAYMKSL